MLNDFKLTVILGDLLIYSNRVKYLALKKNPERYLISHKLFLCKQLSGFMSFFIQSCLYSLLKLENPTVGPLRVKIER